MVNWGDARAPERFWDKVMPEPNSGCWLWTDMDGRKFVPYRMQARRGSQNINPNRFAYQTFIAPFHKWKIVSQACRNECCVNPAHLELKTVQDLALAATDISGQRFGLLVALRRLEQRGAKVTLWECRCDCGSTTTVTYGTLKHGRRKSCGCKGIVKHGSINTPTHRSWTAMLSRCRNSNNPAYANYGGRGIKVCEQWHSYTAFVRDMGERPTGTSIDRINPNGHYEPSNCRWSDNRTQANNKRTSLGYISDQVDLAVSRVTNDNYSRADVIELLKSLKFDLCGRSDG